MKYLKFILSKFIFSLCLINILHNSFYSTVAAIKLYKTSNNGNGGGSISSSSSNISSNKHNHKQSSTKIYLSDLLKEIDQNYSSTLKLVQQQPTTSITLTSTTTPKIIRTTTQLPKTLTLEEYLNQTSNNKNHYESDYTKNTGPYCKVNYRKFPVKISDECQSFNYPMVECTGYCQSQSIIWKNHDNIQTASCCSMISVYEKSAKLYCTKRLEANDMKNDYYKSFRDDEVAKLFQESFNKHSWKSHKVVFKGKKLYSGYYTVKIYYNATCQCEYYDD